MRVGTQDIAEKLLLLAAHAALGIFFSGAFGLLLYIVMVPIVQSFWSIADINFALLAVLTIGFGATVGTFLAWLEQGPKQVNAAPRSCFSPWRQLCWPHGLDCITAGTCSSMWASLAYRH